MKALLITAEGINAIEIDNTLAAMYGAIGCEVITAAGSPAPGHVAWVDDNGALTVKEGTQAASVPWHGDILFGRILVTAIDEEGDTADATIDASDLCPGLYVGSMEMVNGTLTSVVKPAESLEVSARRTIPRALYAATDANDGNPSLFLIIGDTMAVSNDDGERDHWRAASPEVIGDDDWFTSPIDPARLINPTLVWGTPVAEIEEGAQHCPEELESDQGYQTMPDLDQVCWDDSAETIRAKIAAALEHTAADPRMKAEEATATLLTSVMFDIESPEQAEIAHRVTMECVLPAMTELAREYGLAVVDLSEWTIGTSDEDTDAAVSLRIRLIPEASRDRYIAHHIKRARMSRIMSAIGGAIAGSDETH